MTLTQLSIDGGLTYVDMPSNVRIVFREAAQDDDEELDLHICITDEGMILDLVGQESGLVNDTASLDLDALVGLTT